MFVSKLLLYLSNFTVNVKYLVILVFTYKWLSKIEILSYICILLE